MKRNNKTALANGNRGLNVYKTLYKTGVLPVNSVETFSGGEDLSNSFGTEAQSSPLDRGSAWINTEPLTSQALKGKVILIEFCTYTCINWLRTLPYIRSWSEKYKKNGLIVIGVHTPEFRFESNIDNVRRAITGMNISFPVVVDNNRLIWDAFNNSYWPALYFIDVNGRVRHYQFGEGEYENSEKVIQQLLEEAGSENVDHDLVSDSGAGIEMAPDLHNLQSGEQYLGYYRSENFVSPGGTPDSRRVFTFPPELRHNQWAVSGDWTLDEYSVRLHSPGGKIAIRFHARDLHLVMGAAAPVKEVRYRAFIDGKIVSTDHGIDIDDQGNGLTREQRLYQLIRQTGPIADREFVIEFFDPGAEAFSFTFG